MLDPIEDKRSQVTIVVLENRQMIATILAELLAGAGYATRIVSRIADAADILAQCQPGMLLVDTGMIRPEVQTQWQELQQQVAALGIPLLNFSCSPLPALAEETLILRSPGDFAMVVQWVDAEWRKKQPYLGTQLIERGLVGSAEVEVTLRIQRELAQIGRDYSLGDLLVRLGMLSAEDLAQVLDLGMERR